MTESKEKIKIVTHSSGFHTDDIFAVATLSLILEREGKEFSITRSRDMDIARSADYLVDFGGEHNPDTNRFDHHQEGKAGERSNGIPYASFGLVWKKFGKGLCGDVKVSEKIDSRLVQPIDALDNGVKIIKNEIEGVFPVDIGLISFIFYPTWKEEDKNIDDTFVELVTYAKFLIKRFITYTTDEMEAERFVLDAYNNAEDKRLIVVGNNKYPWNEVLSKFPEPLFAVYKNITDESWSIKGLRDDMTSFVCRKFLPESWAGKTGADLEKVTGVSGARFCHNHVFMAVAKTKEAILKMAEIALNS